MSILRFRQCLTKVRVYAEQVEEYPSGVPGLRLFRCRDKEGLDWWAGWLNGRYFSLNEGYLRMTVIGTKRKHL